MGRLEKLKGLESWRESLLGKERVLEEVTGVVLRGWGGRV